ncbi:centrosomal protein CEP57L1 isoform X1 [Mastacembelus armatus]|uniref:centrosomal protein CEP57L1 isoform X1 n=1 Tax=Mastacembelus armatus TaxID=205130 RepID=UPI000E45E4AF|nr:centrosomal protein CEP57L1 isoform X1 [Mastacembelus armatus]
MDAHHDQSLDSPSKNSYIGSYYQPPERILPLPRQLDFSAHSSTSMDSQVTTRRVPQAKPNIDSKAVVDALKTLQEKIRRLELERKQAEKSYQQFSDAQKHQQVTASYTVTSQSAETGKSGRKELDLKMQSAEARCKVLEKQLDYMRKMVENARRERNVVMENQASLQNQQLSSSNTQSQQEKLEKLELEYLKLSRTQTLAEMKLAILEQRLVKEEHERKLVQDKADELQRELDINLRLSVPTTEETKPKKKAKTSIKKASKQSELVSPRGPRRKQMPFVAGTSTSPSHSVHANVQSILHMMKHHQPQLCERVSVLHKSRCSARKSLQKDFSPSSTAVKKSGSLSEKGDQSLGSLSDLLLALQDELGQMSFEQQELVRQIDATQHREHKEDLQSELERLVARMEEKGAQITKLHKHQQMILMISAPAQVHRLTQSQPCAKDYTGKKQSGITPPVPSPVKAKEKGKKSGPPHNNLQLLRETQKLRNSLKQDDLTWET